MQCCDKDRKIPHIIAYLQHNSSVYKLMQILTKTYQIRYTQLMRIFAAFYTIISRYKTNSDYNFRSRLTG
jgi:hypothetical protein